MDGELCRLIGANIRERRLSIGWTQKAMGERLGVSYQQVQKYEKGANSMPAEKLVSAAVLFGCSIDELCGLRLPPVPLQIVPLVRRASLLSPEVLTKLVDLLGCLEAGEQRIERRRP